MNDPIFYYVLYINQLFTHNVTKAVLGGSGVVVFFFLFFSTSATYSTHISRKEDMLSKIVKYTFISNSSCGKLRSNVFLVNVLVR